MASHPEDSDEAFDQDSFKWMSIIVLILAVSGFFGLAWYAYENSTQHMRIEDVLLVEADDAPYRRAPDEKGGMEFVHKDKKAYALLDKDTIDSGKSAKAAPKAEVPDAALIEKAQKATEPAKEETKETVETLFSEAETKKTRIEEKKEALKKELKEETVSTYVKPKEPVKVAEKKPEPVEIKTPAPVKPTPKTEKKAEAPKVVEKNVEPKKPEPVKTVQRKAPAKPKAAPASGSYQVQIGAFRSNSEAETQWKKIRSKHSDIIGSLSRKIVRADLGDKGIYYRLRVTGLSSSDAAKSLCATLSARGQACFPAGKAS